MRTTPKADRTEPQPRTRGRPAPPAELLIPHVAAHTAPRHTHIVVPALCSHPRTHKARRCLPMERQNTLARAHKRTPAQTQARTRVCTHKWTCARTQMRAQLLANPHIRIDAAAYTPTRADAHTAPRARAHEQIARHAGAHRLAETRSCGPHAHTHARTHARHAQARTHMLVRKLPPVTPLAPLSTPSVPL